MRKYKLIKHNQMGGNKYIENTTNITNIILNSQSYYDKKLWMLFVQLFIEYYYFNKTTKTVQLIRIDKKKENEEMYDFTNFDNYDVNSINPKILTNTDLNTIINNINDVYIKEINNQSDIELISFANNYIKYVYNVITECKNFDEIIMNNKSFYDAKHYSIYILVKILINKNFLDNYTIFLYISDYNIIDTSTETQSQSNQLHLISGHVFIINHHFNKSLEAISIQLSLVKYIDSVCNNKHAGISSQLFEFIFEHFKSDINAIYIYAYAWEIMSNLLVKKFNFYQLKSNGNNHTINNNKDVFIVPDIFINLIQEMTKTQLSPTNYIFTFKSLNKHENNAFDNIIQ